MQINQHPHHAQAVFSATPSATSAAAKQQGESATASTGAEEDRDTVELTRPNVQAIEQLLHSDRNLQLPPLPAAAAPTAHNAGSATNPEARPPSAPVLGDTRAEPSIPDNTAPAATSPIASAPAGAGAMSAAGKGEEKEAGKGALSEGTEELSKDEQREVQELKSRDREVRAHEQAHMAAAGPYSVGGPSYEYQRGPDNRQYAVGGEVQIDTSEVSGDPEATIRKAQVIRRAATAPAEPSSQDRSVAAAAGRMEAKARQEMTQQQLEEMKSGGQREGAGSIEEINKTAATGQPPATDSTSNNAQSETAPAGGTGASGDAGALFDLMA